MPSSESRRKKLALLQRSITRGDMAGASRIINSGKPVAGAGAPDGRAELGYRKYQPENPITLEHACPGAQTLVAMPMGTSRYWRIHRTLEQVSPEHAPIARDYAAVLRGAGQRFDELEATAALCHAANGKPEDLLFMDVESCGFSGAIIFLIGLMCFRDGQFHFEQYLARTYAEEAAILAAFCGRYAAAPVLVTFNGKAFDMNMIRERCVFHGLAQIEHAPPHLDLLMEARKRWRGRLPNCKLQTLEQHLCGRHRVGDIPGWAIADAYHKFVDTNDARQIRDIVHHNLLDLLTMAQLITIMLTGRVVEP